MFDVAIEQFDGDHDELEMWQQAFDHKLIGLDEIRIIGQGHRLLDDTDTVFIHPGVSYARFKTDAPDKLLIIKN